MAHIDIVERIAARPDLWQPLVAADPCDWVTARLPVPEGIEVIVATWATFSGLRLRSYARSTVVYQTVTGTITELRPDIDGRLLPRRFAPGVSGVIRPGEVHDLRNEQASPAVTIQAFSQRVAAMTPVEWTGAVARRTLVATDRPGWLGT